MFLDLKTGIVRDCFSYYGLLGTMPCYHDNITDNAWKYGNNLLNHTKQFFDNIYDEINGFLDWSDNTALGIVGGCIITLGVSLFLFSNPIG
ncbi:hypothetical protein [uncultured Methanobrevibacter sp.]|uniref:hypothetical protein n=1 Tax=uncultured Methanobrevibacter sp. TaxID=253161 RepID=UPI0025DB90C0|nr:hypothetical protein [uncultured Methanobrevibacter sp.]